MVADMRQFVHYHVIHRLCGVEHQPPRKTQAVFAAATAKTGAGCGLARVMRKELKERGINSQLVLYSTEPAKKCVVSEDGRNAPGSISFCPPVAGYILASKVIKDLIAK